MWELVNESGGWFHPVHIHFVDFRVLSRNGRPAAAYEQGGKDVVYLGPKETARVLVHFDRGRGRYMMHCHNLVHEDHDMMTQFEIRDPERTAPDPLSEPSLWLPAGEL
ncbi:multicopper oxidase domain-containing protein [Nocardioides litoris]|uniref:multicopper oxidase domain-containing protein n=1 Tax=Nocardioides litoris TaxID=1926648 RepID=UPI00147704C8|nr:multicopper oxidase domain-containing protein [Nocardioides litoris]